jgi:hypothetical protein
MKVALAVLEEAAGEAMLHAAAWLIPASHRMEWLSEWRGELWQVRHSQPGQDRRGAAREALRFCLGAMPDAWELFQMARMGRPRRAPLHRSAGYCLMVLALILAVGCAVALRSPAVMAELHPSRYALRSDLVYIKDAHAGDWTASISAARYLRWAHSHQQYFSGFAFYRTETAALETGRESSALPYALASANFFSLTGLPVELGSAAPGREPALVLSDALWRKRFAADPAVVGRTVRLGGRAVRVTAVAPDGCWRLPGEPQAWLLVPDALLPASGLGSTVARMKPEGWQLMWEDRINIEAYDAEGNAESLWALSLAERTRGPWGIYLVAVLLAMLALPAITSVAMVDDLFVSGRSSRQRQWLRWEFLGAKLLLLLGILLLVPLDLIYVGKPGYQPSASGVHLVAALGMSLFGLWWAVADQRKRCPVCLRRVTHPARVGIASRTFLAWNGTELMCTGGHTLLEIPALPTSWFGAPRWVYLDDSWEFLFAA